MYDVQKPISPRYSHAVTNLLKYKAHASAYLDVGPTPSLKQLGMALPIMLTACVDPAGSIHVGVFIHAGGDHGLAKIRSPVSGQLDFEMAVASVMRPIMPDVTSC